MSKKREKWRSWETTKQNVAVLFPGQGAFYQGALKEIVTCYPQVMSTFEEIDPVSRHAFGHGISELLFGRHSSQEETAQASSFALLQLAMYGINVALYRLLASHGLRPTVLMGHSFGELAAFVCAVAFSLAEGAAIVCQRVHALQCNHVCQGSMLALKTSNTRAQKLVDVLEQQQTVIAAEKSELQTVVAGPADAMKQVAALARVLHIPCISLQSPYPFHSPWLQPVVNDFYASIRHLVHRPLQYPVYSPIFQRYYRADDQLTWCLAQHLIQRVYFHEAIVSLWSQHIKVFEARRSDPFEQIALAVSREALAHAQLDITDALADEVGVCFGSCLGGITSLHGPFQQLYEAGPDRISPFLITRMVVDGASSLVSLHVGARGPNWTAISACASSGNAIGEAWELIRRGDAQVMIAGGAEKAITPLILAAFDTIHALSRYNEHPEQACRPFDAQRNGFVLGEASAVVILEDLDVARARGARILAEMVGYGSTGDAFHVTEPAPGGTGLVRAMRRALQKAGLRPDQVDYLNAHGTGTKYNDSTETQAIKACFGEHAYRLAISSTKSMTGHTLGAAGAVEAVIAVQSLLTGSIPPTINLEHPDPECDLDYVPNKARHVPVRVAMSNSMGFGGHNTSLVFKHYEEGNRQEQSR